MYKQKNDLNSLPSTTYTKYDVQKKPDPRVQDAIDKYGADSQEAKDAAATVKQEGVTQATAMASVKADYLSKMQKFVNGDMSYTADQAAQVDAYVAPVKDVITKTASDLLSKYQGDDVALHEAVDKIGTAIDQTGFDTQSALEAAGVQIEQNGKDLNAVLDEVNSSTQAKFKFQQDLMFQQIDKQVSQQAAMLGLPPGSAAENYQKAKLKNDTFTSLQLQLAEQTAKGKLGVAEQVASGKQQISFSKVALASSQGQKKEDLAKQNLAITGNTQAKEESLQSSVGSALVGLEESKQNTLKNLAYNGIPQMLGVAQGGASFQTNQAGAQQQQNLAGMSPVAGQLAPEVARQTTEATTTQTSSPSFLSTLGSIVGMGAGVAGTVSSAINPSSGGSSFSNMFSGGSSSGSSGGSGFNLGNFADQLV